MTTLRSPRSNVSSRGDTKHFELFFLIWLDTHAQERPNIEQKLRSIINQLEKFQDVEECQDYIEHTSSKDRLVLLVSEQYGRNIVPRIHQFRQVLSIYVHCIDATTSQEWPKQYSKVKGVFTNLDELISRIAKDYKTQKKVEEPFPISTFYSKDSKGTSIAELNGRFVFNQILIECLLQLKGTDADKDELIKNCKKHYKGNEIELRKLADFKNDYTSDQVLEWYTKESFFYRTLNAALRNEDIHTIFLLRSYITDIYRQLQRYQSRQAIRVYRSQMTTPEEVHVLRECLGQFISTNSFFSTSADYHQAYSFLSRSPGLERVVFEITANPATGTTKPFADISRHSVYKKETEVLFMVGSVFRLRSIDRDDDRHIWEVKMTLAGEDEYDPERVLSSLKKQNIDGEINLRVLGKVLWKMGEFDLARKYLHRSLRELPVNDLLRVSVYEDLSKITSQTGDYDRSQQYLEKAAQCKQQSQAACGTSFRRPNQLTVLEHAQWKPHGITVAGGNGNGAQLHQLSYPLGIFLTTDKAVYIADWGNDRILRWKCHSDRGEIVAGGNGQGRRNDQLSYLTDVAPGRDNHSYIVCDRGNRRVMHWSCQDRPVQQVLITDIACYGIATNKDGLIYVTDTDKNQVTRWTIDDQVETVVAGGNGPGSQLHQLHHPTFLFVDDDLTVYVSDRENQRVVKWTQGAAEGVVVAGGNGQGENLNQLCSPEGVLVDHLGRIYVVDSGNHRVVCWCEGNAVGTVVVGGNGKGGDADQLNGPTGLSFDVDGSLYVADHYNNRVQKFDISLEQRVL